VACVLLCDAVIELYDAKIEEVATSFLVIVSVVNEFRATSKNMQHHWVKLLNWLTVFPYSVILEEPTCNPITKAELDTKYFGAGKFYITA